MFICAENGTTAEAGNVPQNIMQRVKTPRALRPEILAYGAASTETDALLKRNCP
jgi:hypothetical protein